MKKGLKKFLSVLLVMTMLVSVFSVSSFAADVPEDITEVTEQENVPGTEDTEVLPDEEEENVPETDVETPTEEEDSDFGIEFVGPGEYGENLLNSIKTAFFFTLNFPQMCISMVIFGPIALLVPVILLYEYACVFGALFGIKVSTFLDDSSFADILKDNFEMNLDFLDMYF